MSELPATSGRTSVQTDLSVSNSVPKPQVKFKDRMVTPSKPSQQHSVKVSGEASGRTPSSGDEQLKLQDRNTAHVSDDANSDPKRFDDSMANDQVFLESSDDAETASRTSDDFVVSSSGSERSEVEDDPDNVVSPPNTSFPVPVDSKTDGDTITIGNTGADNDVAINGDETITIEGGGKVNKGKFSRALKAIANWFMGLFDNKIAVGLAVFFALTFIFGLLASPVGAPLVFILMTGLAAAITCGLTGLLIADLAPDIGQQQLGNSQNPNQNNNNQSDKSFSEIDKTKSGSSSSQPNADIPDEDDTAGSFFMTPNGKTAPTPVINGGGSSPVRESQDAASAADKVDSQLEKMFGTEVFDEWLNENLLRWSNKARFAEFSKTLRGRDDYEELAMNNKLDSLLEDLHRNSNDLSLLASSPLKELDSSGPRQWARLNDFYSTFDKALESLKPTPYECQAMYNRLLRALPKEQFPWVSSNLYAPLLSVGYQRKSLESQSREEVAKIEVSDMLRLALQRLDLYGRGGEQRKESDDQERLRQIQTVKRKWSSDPQDGKPSEEVRIIEKASSIEAKPIKTDEKEIQVEDSEPELKQRTDERQTRVLQKFKHSLNYDPSQLEVPQPAKNIVLFTAFFTNVKDAVGKWGTQEKTPDEAPADLTAKQFQKLVVIELGKAVFKVGKLMMESDNDERSKENAESRDLARLIDIDTRDGRKAFLERIFDSPEVRDIFSSMEASDDEQDKAREHLKRFIH